MQLWKRMAWRSSLMPGNLPENEKGTNHTCDNLSLSADYRGQFSNLFNEDLGNIVSYWAKYDIER